MQNHTLSLLSHGYKVSVVSYANGSVPLKDLINRPKLIFHTIHEPTKITAKNRSIYLVLAVNRSIVQIIQLLYKFVFCVGSPSHIIIQNPPAVPTLFVGIITNIGIITHHFSSIVQNYLWNKTHY